MAVKLAISQNGTDYTDAVHRATIGIMDLLTKEVVVIIKIYSNPAWMMAHPDQFLDRELIQVHPLDIQQYFVPLSQGSNIPLQDAINGFIKTINPKAENSHYPNCRFDYTQAVDL